MQVLPLDSMDQEPLPRKWFLSETLHEVVLPIVVLLIGMGVSLLALKPLLWHKTQ